jgi:multicomponent Na+:H+ antiporter subunit B
MEVHRLKIVPYLLLALFFGILAFASLSLPPRGELTAPMHRKWSAANTPVAGSYYIEHARDDAGTDNIVTVVLADYRSFDTLGETIVVFAAGMACFLILRRRPT